MERQHSPFEPISVKNHHKLVMLSKSRAAWLNMYSSSLIQRIILHSQIYSLYRDSLQRNSLRVLSVPYIEELHYSDPLPLARSGPARGWAIRDKK